MLEPVSRLAILRSLIVLPRGHALRSAGGLHVAVTNAKRMLLALEEMMIVHMVFVRMRLDVSPLFVVMDCFSRTRQLLSWRQ